jgi:hypothetical protein
LHFTDVPNPVRLVHVSKQEEAGMGERQRDEPPGQRREVLDPATVGKMMVEETVRRESGNLTKSPENDMQVLQWLVDHYHNVL